MANVIIAEGLTDDDYIANYTVGYDEFAERVSATPRVGRVRDRRARRDHPHAGP